MGYSSEPDKNAPSVSPGESRRIKILREYAVLDSSPESQFNDLAALAAHICETPIALISLVDSDRQWFKAKVGLETPQTPRSQSFCAHALDKPYQVFVVQDATKDERFSENPLVTGDPGIRFYAGAPLVTRDNATLGTICVIDRVPREISVAQQWGLQALATQVVKKLEDRLDNLKKLDHLTAKIHDFRLEQLQDFFGMSRSGMALWQRLMSFLSGAILDQRFSTAYISGSFFDSGEYEGDVKVTLQTGEPFEVSGTAPLEPYLQNGRNRIQEMYSVDLHFWIENLPSNLSGHESFFLPNPPWTNADGAPIKVARISLRDPEIIQQFRRANDPFDGWKAKSPIQGL